MKQAGPCFRLRRELLLCFLTILFLRSTPTQIEPERPVPDCRSDVHCFTFSHVSLDVPYTFLRLTKSQIGALDAVHVPGIWFSFWMPDGSPAGGVDESQSFFMFPDTDREPPPVNPKTLVSTKLCFGLSHGHCGDPDRGVMNMAPLVRNVPRAKGSKPAADGVYPSPQLFTGTTSSIQVVETIESHLGTRSVFGRAGCDGQSCNAHFFLKCDVAPPYPRYNVCDGSYVYLPLHLQGYLTFIGISDQQTLKMAELLTRKLKDWTIHR